MNCQEIGLVLNDLDQLPSSCRLALVGGSGRNARLAKVLHFLRPDISICAQLSIRQLCGEDADAFFDEHRARILSQVDFVLLTSCKLRDFDQLLARLPEERPRLFIANPNFYHPFMIFDPTEYEDHARRLMTAQGLLPCAGDREIYDLILATMRPKGDLGAEYAKMLELSGRMGRQYFDHINTAAVHTVIEGGVADGWNAVQFLSSFSAAEVYGFEPDVTVFNRSYYKDFLVSTGRFHYSRLGLWQTTDRLHFELNQACQSRVIRDAGEGSLRFLDAISIDEFVHDRHIPKVDFIKLDIEGSEMHALQGAKRTIAEHRPQIAVCIYHLLEHYYEIPLLLAACTEDYILRIGHYSPFHVFSETVLYAIPKDLYLFPQERR